MKLKTINPVDAKAIDILDMGNLFAKITETRSICNLTKEENSLKMQQWKSIISLMTHKDPMERLSALSNLGSFCFEKSLYYRLDNISKQAIIKKIVEQQNEQNFANSRSGSFNSQIDESEIRFKQGLTLSKVLAYQDIQLASDYQVMEENIHADDAERYARKREENTETFFKRLLTRSEKPKNLENFFQQNKILSFIKKNCPETYPDIRIAALSRLLKNYTLQSYLEHADNLAKTLEDILEGENKQATAVSKSSELEILRGLAVYSHRRHNKDKKIKYRKRFELLAEDFNDSEKINEWKNGVIFYCFESKLIEKIDDPDEIFEYYFENLAEKLIKIIKQKLKNKLIDKKTKLNLEYKLGNVYEDQIWILGRYCHEKKKRQQ